MYILDFPSTKRFGTNLVPCQSECSTFNVAHCCRHKHTQAPSTSAKASHVLHSPAFKIKSRFGCGKIPKYVLYLKTLWIGIYVPYVSCVSYAAGMGGGRGVGSRYVFLSGESGSSRRSRIGEEIA